MPLIFKILLKDKTLEKQDNTWLTCDILSHGGLDTGQHMTHRDIPSHGGLNTGQHVTHRDILSHGGLNTGQHATHRDILSHGGLKNDNTSLTWVTVFWTQGKLLRVT